MVYKGVYRDGVVVLRGVVDLPEGASVEVNPVKGRNGARKKRGAAQKAPVKRVAKRSRRKPLDQLAAFGMWKDRPDWKGKSTLEIVAELREKALGRRRRA